MITPRFKGGDVVAHPAHGVGRVLCQWSDGRYLVEVVNAAGEKQGYLLAEDTLTSRPELRPNDEGRRWRRPPVGVHKPYEDKKRRDH